jgi:ankyrin repeat protein
MMASSSGPLAAESASTSKPGEDLVNAAEQGDIGRVRDLLKQGADPDYKNKYGVTALLWAASACNYELVRLLLEEWHANPNDRDSLGQTALMLAVLGPSVRDKARYRKDSAKLDAQQTVQILLTNGADVRIEKSGTHDTALSCAKRGGAEGLLGQRAPQGPEQRKKRNQRDAIIILLQNAEAEVSGGAH